MDTRERSSFHLALGSAMCGALAGLLTGCSAVMLADVEMADWGVHRRVTDALFWTLLSAGTFLGAGIGAAIGSFTRSK